MGVKEDRKFENLNKLVQILLDHPAGLTRAEIGRRLGVHRSTAGEYIDSLEGINAPVYEVSPNRFTTDHDHYEVRISVDMHESLPLRSIDPSLRAPNYQTAWSARNCSSIVNIFISSHQPNPEFSRRAALATQLLRTYCA